MEFVDKNELRMLKRDVSKKIYAAVSTLNHISIETPDNTRIYESYFWRLSLDGTEKNLDAHVVSFVAGFINNCGLPAVIEYFNNLSEIDSKELIIGSYLDGLENAEL